MEILNSLLLTALILVSVAYYYEYQYRKVIQEHKEYWYLEYRKQAKDNRELWNEMYSVNLLKRSEISNQCPVCKNDNPGHSEYCNHCKCQF